MNPLKIVFWDLDGTIADTELNGHRVAYNSAFKEYSLDWNWNRKLYSDLLNIGGGKNRIRFFAKQKELILSNKDINYIYNIKQKYYQSLIDNDEIKPRIGVIRLVNELYSRNIKQWIVTTSGRDSSFHLISRYFSDNVNPFSGYICGEDILRHKPDPEAYKLALTKSNSTTSTSIVIEDSLIGLKAATSANLKCVVTLSPWKKNITEEYKEASLVLDSLGDIDYEAKCLHGYLGCSMLNYKALVSTINC